MQRTEPDSITNMVPLSNTFQAADMHPVSLYYYSRTGFMQLTIAHGWKFYWISHYGKIAQIQSEYSMSIYKQGRVSFSLCRTNKSVSKTVE